MMTAVALLLAQALAVLPADRLAMADRLFDRGEYALAAAEYAALADKSSFPAGELDFRQGECARLMGDLAAAREHYRKLLKVSPLSRFADHARLNLALSLDADERRRELRRLDSDSVTNTVRAAALYHLGDLEGSAELLERSIGLNPKGELAPYAHFRHAVINSKSKVALKRRAAIGELMELHYSAPRELQSIALYLAGTLSYADKRYADAASVLRKYLTSYPNDARTADVRRIVAWCEYLDGHYAEALKWCDESEDGLYLKAAASYALEDKDTARRLFKQYLEKFPLGRYRTAAELPLVRLDFEGAEAAGDITQALVAARRAATLSEVAGDRLRLAWALEKNNLNDQAEATYLAIAAEFPATKFAAEAQYRRAMLLLRNGRYATAEPALAEALGVKDGLAHPSEAWYWRAVAAVKMRHEQEADKFFREALKGNLPLDERREARLALADSARREARDAEAVAAYVELVEEGAAERMSAAKQREVAEYLFSHAEHKASLRLAKALAANEDACWRQAGFALQGALYEAEGAVAATRVAYEEAMKLPVRTEVCAEVALKLGRIISRAGEGAAAEAMLKEAVELLANRADRRVEAYLALAENAEAMGAIKAARGYATVVTTLFAQFEGAEKAQALLKRLPAVEEPK